MMILFSRCVLLLCCFAPLKAFSQVVFEQSHWKMTIEPTTLAITVDDLSHQRSVILSQGGEQHAVSDLQQTNTEAKWSWDNGAYQLVVNLQEQQLAIHIKAKQPGKLNVLTQSADSVGQALILPIAEGHYIPLDNRVWRQFLASELSAINTTQDLSLPIWANQYQNFSAHWLLANPFNNQIQFQLDKTGQLLLALSHQFTSLAPQQEMTILLSLTDNADPLAGAKRYRQWLIENKQFESFADKVKRLPEATKLIGATHVYVWGSDLLAIKDVKDWSQLINILTSKQHDIEKITRHFDNEAQAVLAKMAKNPDRYQKKVLINAINESVKKLARQSWQTEQPDMSLLASSYQQVANMVQQTIGMTLTSPSSWGSGLSVATIDKLSQAGLSRLWIGIGEGWEGGLWHPQAVAAAVNAGYLIAPYDSYQTALPMGFNPDWTTAHLGSQAYQACAITQQDGSLKAGFQKSGHYTNPACIRQWLEQRITVLQEKTGFNSWFLDAYATGMVFDNYSVTNPMTQAENARENSQSMDWVGRQLGLVVGSEDGNAVASQGILFAHGMQTPVIGWGDPELTNPKSRYYLGRWYPNDEPSLFFKSSVLKEPYETIYFDPRYRLPLYQTVFHDSVITSQHWLFDNLKLNNVLIENQLTQLFYNVPALYNVSENTLTQRLPAILAQDEFFRPLHQQLINQSITEFRWLSADKLVQSIRFSNGMVLVANFSSQPFSFQSQQLPAHSVTALNHEMGEISQQFVIAK